MNYYNDNDPHKAAWLRRLIENGLIPPGVVDERSIEDIDPRDLDGYTQHHFFAGIGGWALALALAGWPQNRPVATASCPCQPFSQTGLGLGEKDRRHLWPYLHALNEKFQFPVLFGEQVASPAGRVWLTRVRSDLEGLGYEVGASDLCAAGVSAPHPRQRIFWVAYADEERARQSGETQRSGTSELQSPADAGGRGGAVRLGDTHGAGLQGWRVCRNRTRQRSPWANGVGVPGHDGKMRRIEPGFSPLADGLPDRVALIGGAGDAIVPLLASEFIQAAEEARYL